MHSTLDSIVTWGDAKTKHTITMSARCVIVAPLFICNICNLHKVTVMFFGMLILADIEKQTSAQAIMKPSASKGPTDQGQW